MAGESMIDKGAPAGAAEGRRTDYGKLGWGVVLVALGVLLLLERLDLFYLEPYWRYWPLIIVALGLASLAGARTAEKRRSALWLLGIGLWLLVNTLELLGFWWSDSWPLLVILAGIIGMVLPKRDEGRLGGLWPLAIGLWLLVTVRGWWGLWWDNSWPVLLILIGALLVVRALAEGGLVRRPGTGEG